MSETVSVILCSHNRAGHLGKTLQSLRRVAVPEDWEVELLLVDNASTDATPEVMRAFGHPRMSVRVLREEKQGVSHARNHAVREARGQVLLFTDDDLRFPSDWIEGMATPILQDGADAVAGGVELAEKIRADWMTPLHRSMLASTERIDPNDPKMVVGANMAISREVFETIPGFDPELGPGQLGLGGEVLLLLQMREAGFRIETALDAVVKHCPDTSRLTWAGWDEAARKSGRAGAYRSYHWRHRHYSLPALVAGWIYYALRVLWRQVIPGSGGSSRDQMTMEEFLLRRKKYRVRQHLREYGKEPKYEERGLVKKSEQSIN